MNSQERTIRAIPPSFRSAQVSHQYQAGELTRLEAELADILGGCTASEEPYTVLPLPAEAGDSLRSLTCIALLHDGQVLPLFDLTHLPRASTALERAHLYHRAARTLLEVIALLLEEEEPHSTAKSQDDENNEEGYSCVR